MDYVVRFSGEIVIAEKELRQWFREGLMESDYSGDETNASSELLAYVEYNLGEQGVPDVSLEYNNAVDKVFEEEKEKFYGHGNE